MIKRICQIIGRDAIPVWWGTPPSQLPIGTNLCDMADVAALTASHAALLAALEGVMLYLNAGCEDISTSTYRSADIAIKAAKELEQS